jgi:hypothetical protein
MPREFRDRFPSYSLRQAADILPASGMREEPVVDTEYVRDAGGVLAGP